MVLFQSIRHVFKLALHVRIRGASKQHDLTTSLERFENGVLDQMNSFLMRKTRYDADERYVALV